MREILIPEENEKDLAEIPKNILSQLKIHPVKWVDEVLELALAKPPEPRPDNSGDVAKEQRTESSDEPSDSIRPH